MGLPQPRITDDLSTLEEKLSDLAALWRGHKDQRDADAIVKNYQETLREMIAKGFNDPLDVDSELPKRLMPAEYLNLFKK